MFYAHTTDLAAGLADHMDLDVHNANVMLDGFLDDGELVNDDVLTLEESAA